MEEFISQYPDVIIGVGSLLGSVFFVLLLIVGWGLRTAFVRFSIAVENNTKTTASIESRLSNQETICEICRQHCPYHLERKTGEKQ